MAKEILLYGGIHDSSAETFINSINALSEDEIKDFVVRVSTNGGSPEALFGMVAKVKEVNPETLIKLDGAVKSAGIFFASYMENVEALDVSNFLIHRAAYPSWVEANHMEEVKPLLTKMNIDLRAAFENKVDVVKFEKISKVSLDEIFSLENRIDVEITAKEALKIGLINKITKITPKKAKALNAEFLKIAAEFGTNVDLLEINSDISAVDENHKNKNMTIQDLKTNHPEVFAEAVALGVAEGKAVEKQRVAAWAELSEANSEKAMEGIAGDSEITTAAAIGILKDAEAARAAAAIAAENADDIDTPEAEEEEAGAEVSDAEKVLAEMKEIRKNK